MRNLKRIFGMLLVVAMVFIQMLPTTTVNAAGNGKITVTNAKVGETYSVYRILSLESYNAGADTYVYKVAAGWEKFVSEGVGSQYLTIVDDTQDTDDSNTYVIWKEGVDKDTGAKALATAAITYVENDSKDDTYSVSVTASQKATSTTVEFSGLDLGYYLVDSTLGAICGLTTTDPEANVNEKNIVPAVEKEVQEGNNWGETNDAKIGDTVNFRTTITVGEGTENYVLYDTMSAGLTLKADTIVVKVNGNKVDANNYTVSVPGENGETFTIKFENTYIKELSADTKIVVEYSAILNDEAKIEKTEGNQNETWIKYGDAQESTHDTTITYTYAFDLIKTNGKVQLSGAKFELYDAATEGNLIKLVKVSDGIYRVATAEEYNVEGFESAVIEAGKVTIQGLDHGTYYLEETEAPVGYNKLSSRVVININRVNTETNTYKRLEETVVNSTGAELPITGGVGTVLFITIGSIMIIGFGVLLVTKLRMSKIQA